MSLTEIVYNSTMAYLDTTPKAERKKIGQFFTPTPIAEYMGSLSSNCGTVIHVLDPGAGSGILSAAIIERLLQSKAKHIRLDAYENNADILPLLHENLRIVQASAKEHGVILDYCIMEDNFIIENQFAWTGLIPNEKYDIVIANPPYKKIAKNASEASIMRDIVYGQPNLYFLFMAMGAHLLKRGGEFIYIVPRSFSSGLYFTAFRNYFLRTMCISDLHLFTSRGAIGGVWDSVLQETIIMRAVKTHECPDVIKIAESFGENGCDASNCYHADYHTCIKNDDNAFLFFPSCEHEAKVLDFVNQWPATLGELGYRMKTGTVVDFRETDWMRAVAEGSVVPLLWAYNFHKYRIQFPISVEGKPQYLLDCPETKRLRMRKGNYLLLKRFTSKEEKRRLQCALLLEEDFAECESISTENHLNFITKVSGSMGKDELYGLFVILNSSYLDTYFRILNGSTQVNANEINAMPFPATHDIVQMGRKAMQARDLTRIDCDSILEEQFCEVAVGKAI